jgi:hypothetical protein
LRLRLPPVSFWCLGLIGEFPESEKWKRSRLFTAAKVAVVLGVLGELIGDGGIFKSSSRIQKLTDASLNAAQLELFTALAKIEPRTLSADEKKTIADMIRGKIKRPVNVVIEQNDKAVSFAWSIIAALGDGGVKIWPVLQIFKMPPGEVPPSPVTMHCPCGHAFDKDPLYVALMAAGLPMGYTDPP